ncbi:hypothetical protein V493_05658 [Pseudogymnoascus sp. VKM F-4281 (FW-2241)]|nr:hypothetical protein V493_05658 [Pseudogymnoascus sp. VKM F-4281 (FW-2241)]
MQSRVRSNSYPSPNTTTFLLPTLAEQRCLSVSIENLTITVNRTIPDSKVILGATATPPNPFPRNFLRKEQGAPSARTMRSTPLRFSVPRAAFQFGAANHAPLHGSETELRRARARAAREEKKAPNRTKAREA